MTVFTIETTGALGNYGAALALDALLHQRGVTYYLGLHIADPDGPAPNELGAGGYVRDDITFSLPSARGVVSTNAQVFQGVTADVVRYLGVWDAISNGNLLLKLSLGSHPLGTYLDGKVLLAPGDIAFQFASLDQGGSVSTALEPHAALHALALTLDATATSDAYALANELASNADLAAQIAALQAEIAALTP